VGHIRHDYLLQRNIEILSTYGLGFLNFALFAVGMFLSYHVSHRNPDLVKQYRDSAKKIAQNQRELERLQNKQKAIENRYSQDLQNLIEREEQETKHKTDKHFTIPREEVINLANEINSIITSASSLEQVIISNFHQCLSTFRSVNEQRRVDKSRPAYWNKELPTLKLYFSEYDLLLPFQESGKSEDTDIFPSNGSAKKGKKSENPALSKILSSFLGMFMILSILLFSGCNTANGPSQHSAILLVL